MRNRYRLIGCFVATLMSLAACRATTAADAFYDIPLSDLKITDGQLPKADGENHGNYFDLLAETKRPRVVLEGSGEGYFKIDDGELSRFRYDGSGNLALGHVIVHATNDKEVRGLLFLPKSKGEGMERLAFSIAPAKAAESAKEAYYQTRMDHYARLADFCNAGGAWFRHEVNDSLTELNEIGRKSGRPAASAPSIFFTTSREDAYDLFSGGRAVSENLQLDRLVPEHAQTEKPDVDVDSLQGITIAAIDWKPLIKDAKPKLDPLSKLIPSDQHALLIPSFDAAIRLQEEANGRDSVLLKLVEPQSEDLGVMERYQRQLGLTLSDIGKIVGQAAIKSLAVTGSDPYFPTGTDVAVLFETDHPDVLAGLLETQIAAAAAKVADAKPENDETAGVKYRGVRSPDRTIYSYVAQLNGAVVVTNSLAQLERLAKVGQGIEPIASLDEFKFFRMRYPLGDKDETAFLFISDATIRHWCSPRWRIASARRTFTAAELADLTAENVHALAVGKVKDATLHTDVALVDAGELRLSSNGVSSSTQGSIAWMTPIVELPIEKLTKSEADAYNQWRDNYQRNWRWAFDPIGFRIGVADQKLSGDLTVMPLVIGSEYREFVNISRGAKIAPDAGDRHDAMLNMILALNIKSDMMRQAGNMASMFAPQAHIDPLSWLGSSVSLYVDDDPIWKQLRDLPADKRQEESRKLWAKLPIALRFEVSSSLKLTAFLAAARAFIEQTAPGMTEWEALTYHDEPYVRVKPTARGRGELGENADVAIYYSPSADGLFVTLNESVLKHAIDRRLVRAAQKNGDQKKSADVTVGSSTNDNRTAMPWLGESFCLQVDRRMIEALSGPMTDNLSGGEAEAAMQLRAWSNIPILNEWKRMFPDQDPVKVHERLWHTTLVCPGGGKYVWNNEWKTMESTAYGHPGQPKEGPEMAAAMQQFENANFGLTFEEQGLRARIELERAAAPK